MASAPAGGEDATAGCAWSSQPNEEEDASKEGGWWCCCCGGGGGGGGGCAATGWTGCTGACAAGAAATGGDDAWAMVAASEDEEEEDHVCSSSSSSAGGRCARGTGRMRTVGGRGWMGKQEKGMRRHGKGRGGGWCAHRPTHPSRRAGTLQAGSLEWRARWRAPSPTEKVHQTAAS